MQSLVQAVYSLCRYLESKNGQIKHSYTFYNMIFFIVVECLPPPALANGSVIFGTTYSIARHFNPQFNVQIQENEAISLLPGQTATLIGSEVDNNNFIPGDPVGYLCDEGFLLVANDSIPVSVVYSEHTCTQDGNWTESFYGNISCIGM